VSTRISRRRLSDPVLRRLELTVLRRLDGLLQGDYAGLVPGPGNDAGDARVYEPGDDVRRIDWSLTARTNETHVRDSIAERELEMLIVVDMSESLAFGTAKADKRDVARDLAGAFAVLGSTSGNRVGALLAVDRPVYVPARSGQAHAATILATIQRTQSGPGDLTAALRQARRLARRRGMVVVVSDFLVPDGWQRELQGLAARHDVVAVEVVDEREMTMPDVGFVMLEDAESGRRRAVDTRDPLLRARFAASARARRMHLARAVTTAGADHLPVRTDEDWAVALAQFAVRRRRRRMASGVR